MQAARGKAEVLGRKAKVIIKEMPERDLCRMDG